MLCIVRIQRHNAKRINSTSLAPTVASLQRLTFHFRASAFRPRHSLDVENPQMKAGSPICCALWVETVSLHQAYILAKYSRLDTFLRAERPRSPYRSNPGVSWELELLLRGSAPRGVNRRPPFVPAQHHLGARFSATHLHLKMDLRRI